MLSVEKIWKKIENVFDKTHSIMQSVTTYDTYTKNMHAKLHVYATFFINFVIILDRYDLSMYCPCMLSDIVYEIEESSHASFDHMGTFEKKLADTLKVVVTRNKTLESLFDDVESNVDRWTNGLLLYEINATNMIHNVKQGKVKAATIRSNYRKRNKNKNLLNFCNNNADHADRIQKHLLNEETNKEKRVKERMNAKHAKIKKRIDDDLCCSITCEIFVEPVIAADGMTYEKEAILKWFSQGNVTSPNTNIKLDNFILKKNRSMEARVLQAKNALANSP